MCSAAWLITYLVHNSVLVFELIMSIIKEHLFNKGIMVCGEHIFISYLKSSTSLECIIFLQYNLKRQEWPQIFIPPDCGIHQAQKSTLLMSHVNTHAT